MSSTTLITFLVRTPSSVRSVELLGSWDNFSRPYPMERDKRTGSGHWRGCHTFTDIICDGSSPNPSPGRTGGLKMGGTYWYYYRLDGDIEYYNEAEPVTSLCPLLPGQPVNILHMPVSLPDTEALHRRDNSVTSTRSAHRTMDPKDKFMNPRTPPKPHASFARLRTSPPIYNQHPANSLSLANVSASGDGQRSISQPANTAPSLRGRFSPRVKVSRSASPPLTRGLRAAIFNIAGSRSPSRDRDNGIRSRSVDRNAEHCGEISLQIPVSNSSSNYSSRFVSPANSPIDRPGASSLPFRLPHYEQPEKGSALPSIHVRRASKSSRENTPLATLDLACSPGLTKRGGESSSHALLGPLEEVSSIQTTSVPAGHAKNPSKSTANTSCGLWEKRLPTLPNSPSSVMEEELRALEALNQPLDMELLRSHFSDFTSGIQSGVYPESPVEKSRFSEWSADTELVSPASMTSCSTLNADFSRHSFTGDPIESRGGTSEAVSASNGPPTPIFGTEEFLSPTQVASDSPLLGTGDPSCGVGSFSATGLHVSSVSTLGASECDDSVGEPDPKRCAGIFPTEVIASLPVNSPRAASPQSKSYPSQDFMAESTAMKELMDEVGYLGDMISSGL